MAERKKNLGTRLNSLRAIILTVPVFIGLVGLIVFLVALVYTKGRPPDLLSSTVIAAGLTTSLYSLIYGTLIRGSEKQEILKTIESLLGKVPILPSMQKYGLERIHETFDFKTIFKETENGGELKILDTYIPTYAILSDSLIEALQRGVKIKWLVVDPGSQVARQRANEISPKFEYPIFKVEVEQMVNTIATTLVRLVPNFIANIEMRYYDDLACMPMYILKNRVKPSKLFFSFFLTEATVEYHHFEAIAQPGGFFADFEKYFDDKWERHKDKAIDLSKVIEKMTLAI